MVQWGMSANRGKGMDSVFPGSLIKAQRKTENYFFAFLISLSMEILYKEIMEYSIELLVIGSRRQSHIVIYCLFCSLCASVQEPEEEMMAVLGIFDFYHPKGWLLNIWSVES